MVRNWASGCCITNRSGSLHAAIPESSGPCLSLLTCILHGHRHLGWRSSPCMPVVQKDTGLSEFLNPGCQDGNFAAFSIFQPPIAQPFGMADFQNLWFYTYGILRLQASQLDGRHFRRPTMIRPMRWQLQRAVSANACRRSCRNTRSSIWSQNFAPKLSKHFQAFSSIFKHFQSIFKLLRPNRFWHVSALCWGDQALDASKRQNRGSTTSQWKRKVLDYFVLLYFTIHMTLMTHMVHHISIGRSSNCR